MILISACLMNIPCRYDGGCFLIPELAELLSSRCLITICPEVYAGMSTPRASLELTADRRAVDREGNDYTDRIRSAIQNIVSEWNGILPELAVLKERSPTCGSHVIYDGFFSGTITAGQGLFTEVLRDMGIPVINEFQISTVQNIVDNRMTSDVLLSSLRNDHTGKNNTNPEYLDKGKVFSKKQK